MPADYPNAATELLKAGVAVLGLVAAYLLLQLGLLGWVVIAATLAVASALWKILRGSDDDRDAESTVSCRACGAPNPPARETCKHCDEPL